MFEAGFEFAPGYRLQSKLGAGQFGEVWKVTAPGGTLAAVKFVDLSGDERKWKKEYQGVQRVKQIRNPNLMPILAIWVLGDDGKALSEVVKSKPAGSSTEAADPSQTTPYVGPPESERLEGFSSYDGRPRWLAVSMLLGGKNLGQRLTECRRQGLQGIPPDELLDLIEDAAKGLDFLNAPGSGDLGDGQGLQHCDVKPENIVLVGNSAVVCDFGLARIMSRDQIDATSIAGTAAYMSPETIRRQPSRHSDQYALAITYFYLRTGVHPFRQNLSTYFEVADAHLNGRLSFDQVSAAEQKVLRRATARRWEDRHQSCRAMVDALRQAVREDQEPPKSWRWSGRRSVAAVAVVLLLGAWLILPRGSDPPPELPTNSGESINSNSTNGDNDQPPPVATYAAADWHALLEQLVADPAGAEEAFDEVLDQFQERYPSLVQPLPIQLSGHQGDIEQVQFLRAAAGDPEAAAPLLLIHSLDRQPRIFSLQPIGEVVQKHWDDLLQASDPLVQAAVLLEQPGQAGPQHQPPYVMALAVSADGQWAASGGAAGEVIVWKADGSAPLIRSVLSLGPADVATLAWSPDGRYLLAADLDSHLHLISAVDDWPEGSEPQVASLPLPSVVHQMLFDPWGESLLVRDIDGRLSLIRWKAIEDWMLRQTEVQPKRISTSGSFVNRVGIIPGTGGEPLIIAAGDDGEISLYSLPDDGELIERRSSDQRSVNAIDMFHDEDRRVVVSGDDRGRLLLDPGDDRSARLLAGHRDAVTDIAISPDGRYVATVSRDGWGILRSLDEAPEQFIPFSNDRRPLTVVRWDPQGRWLVTGGYDGSLAVWDARHLRLLLACRPRAEVPADDPLPSPEAEPERGQVSWHAASPLP